MARITKQLAQTIAKKLAEKKLLKVRNKTNIF